MKKGILLLYSLSILPVWGISFLAPGADQVSCLAGMIYVLVGNFIFLREKGFKLPITEQLLLLAGSIIYFLIACLIFIIDGEKVSVANLLIDPLLIGLGISALNIFFLKDVTKLKNLFVFSTLIFYYVYVFYPDWQESLIIEDIKNEVTAFEGVETTTSPIERNIQLQDFSFIDSNLDTIRIVPKGKFTLLETWNETCLPCMKAFKEMPAFYQQQEDKMNTFYVYENRKAAVRNNFDKIFSFDLIYDASKILIDIDQAMQHELEIIGYPAFLLFDKDGELVFFKKGYYSSEELASELLSLIK